jgi:phospholipid N-methyltransferase
LNRIQKRSEIIGYLRGYYFFPIFFYLYDKRYIDKFIKKNNKITLKDLKKKNNFFLEKILNYLVRIKILIKKNKFYSLSDTGLILNKRIGAMYILHSYSNILTDIKRNINYGVNKRKLCNRKENVIGSGLLHVRKFFEPALKKIDLSNKKFVLDIGCGDGTFLKNVIKRNKNIGILGCDLSKESVKQTKKKIKLKKNDLIFNLNGSNLSEIKNILKKNKIHLGKDSIISMWFLLHEISNNSKDILVKYLSNVKKNFSDTPLLIGEISKQTNELLQKHKDISLMPEFYLFHEISGQGLLSEKDFFSVFRQSGYSLQWIINTDKINFNKTTSNSNFICMLKPI